MARKFSRWMPPYQPQPITATAEVIGGLILSAFVVGFIYLLISKPFPVGGFCVTAVVFVLVARRAECRRLARLAAERPDEDIGTFARALDRRTQPFDPWVVRATWDALQPYAAYPGGRVPLRPTDRLIKDLNIDPDDLVMDILGNEIGGRAGRTLDGVETNPLFGRCETVGDLVRLMSSQPLTERAEEMRA